MTMKAFLDLYRELLQILPGNARRFVVGYAVVLSALAVLDAASLGLLAVVINPLVSGAAVNLPIVGPVEGIGVVVIIGVVCVLVLAKGVLSSLMLWIATRRFAVYELELGSRLFDGFLRSPWVQRLQRNSSDLVRAIDSSVSYTISSVLLPGAGLLGELVTTVTVITVLAIAQPVVALITLVYLGLVGAAQFFWITKRARQAGRVNLHYSALTSQLVTEMIGALKEITLRNKSDNVSAVVRENRVHSTRARANIQFLSQVPRFVLEAALIGGFVIVGAVGFALDGMAAALSAVAVFALAGFRLAPSLVRTQYVVSLISANVPHARRVINEIRKSDPDASSRITDVARALPQHPKVLSFENVGFRYSADVANAVTGVSTTIPFGSTVALVGASGAGKSTFVDLVLGLMEPTEGEIALDGVPLREFTDGWRSRIAYVPQDVALFDRTVAENVALTWDGDFDSERVRSALAQAQLLSVIESRPDGIHGKIGERGLSLSGGQRQRMGIARALYAQPLVLVMDEATSALDTATEAAVTDAIKRLRGSMTIITVAHRLSTVMHSDQILFMSEGRVAAEGTFEELVAAVPEFAHQAGLAGLASGE